MDWDRVEGNWKQVKGKASEHSAHRALPGADVDRFKAFWRD